MIRPIFSKGPYVMGVVNVTPDSFSDGGAFFDPDAAIEHGLRLVEEGADILDIGGESTRPGAKPVDPEEEIRRVIPVIKGLSGRAPWISVDTRHAETMRAAIESGANFINDISALSFDPQSLGAVRSSDAPICLMHMRGTPQTMSEKTHYNNILEDVLRYFCERIHACESAGIGSDRIILDPGIGFAKTTGQNLALIHNIGAICALGFPVLLGVSRKRFISAVAGESAPVDRLGGSLAAGLYGVSQGVKILRVHDVAATRQALSVHAAIESAVISES
ncbi:MAG: dihydropteroate synthase [Rhodospirillales bacterium]|nr:dihydropteroate synthase [Rhodospirillales bacterium]